MHNLNGWSLMFH